MIEDFQSLKQLLMTTKYHFLGKQICGFNFKLIFSGIKLWEFIPSGTFWKISFLSLDVCHGNQYTFMTLLFYVIDKATLCCSGIYHDWETKRFYWTTVVKSMVCHRAFSKQKQKIIHYINYTHISHLVMIMIGNHQ